MNEEYILWLDDARGVDYLGLDPIKTKVAKNYASFIQIVEDYGLPSEVFFDHDLAEQKDGCDCAQWLVNYCLDRKLDLPEWYIHSANVVGKQEIESVLRTYEKFLRN